MLTLSRFSLIALVVLFAACGSEDAAPDVVMDDTVVQAPVLGEAEADADSLATLDDPIPADELSDAPADEPEVSAAADVSPPPSDPVPAAGPPEDGDQPISAVSDGMLGIQNATGRSLRALHIAGCTESEGNDWDTMETWATDYLRGETVAAGGATMIELAPGCYNVKSILEGGASMQEEVQTTTGMVYEIEIDV